MNSTSLLKHAAIARVLALTTILSLLISAFPVAFFVASAADTLTGPHSTTVTSAAPFATTAVDASGHENLTLSFDYEAEGLDNGDSFTYGWRSGATDTVLGTISGIDESSTEPATLTDETGTINVPLPAGAEVADLQIYLTAQANSGADEVNVSNLTVTGDEAAPVVVLDTVKPVMQVLTPVNNYVTGGNFDISVKVTDDVAIAKVVINLKDGTGAHLSTCLNEVVAPATNEYLTDCTVDIASLPNGNYQFRANALDTSENISNTVIQNFTVDRSKPFLEVLDPPNGFVTYGNFDITVHATDNVGLKQIVVNIKDAEGNNLAPCLNEFVGPGVTDRTTSCTVDVSLLEPGFYGFRANARDTEETIGNTVIQTFEVKRAKKASLEITSPVLEQTLTTGLHTFTAEYIDDDETIDPIQWAIRAGTCEANTGTVAGNVDGFSNSSTFSGSDFSAAVDMTGWANGEYCFVVNPSEGGEETDLRATREFTLAIPPPVCTVAIKSGTGAVVKETNTYAVPTFVHGAWTAVIPGATWIWETFNVVDPSVVTTRTFKETFTANGISAASLTVAADNTYKVFVNGVLRYTSNDENNFGDIAKDTYADIGSYFVSGNNTVEVEVTNLAALGSTPESNPAGARYALDVTAGTDCAVTTQTTPIVIEEPQTYLIEGYKYEVVGEAQVPKYNWTIYASNGIDEPLVTTTDELGQYSFEVEAGDWTVSEALPVDWIQSSVIQDGETVVTEAATEVCSFSFGQSEEMFLKTTEVMADGTCDFYNQFIEPEGEGDGEVVPPPTEPTNNNRGGGGGGNGTRVTRLAGPATPLVLGASTAQCGMLLTDYLKRGQTNDSLQVMYLQAFLQGQGYSNLTMTGTFDEATEAAVKAFQEAYRAEILTPWVSSGILTVSNPTGWVYQLTRWKINNLVCPGSEAAPVLIP